MTRAEEDRQTATDMTRTLFTELTQSLQKERGTERQTSVDTNAEKDKMKVKKG